MPVTHVSRSERTKKMLGLLASKRLKKFHISEKEVPSADVNITEEVH